MTPRTPKLDPAHASLILAMIDASAAHCPDSPLCWLKGYCAALAAQHVGHDARREPDFRPGAELEEALHHRRDTERSVGVPIGRMTPKPKRVPP